MKYVKYNYVDSVTGVSVAVAPAANGPSMPTVEGLKFEFSLESEYPTAVATMYGTCTGDPEGVTGIVEVITKEQFESIRETEMQLMADKKALEPAYEEGDPEWLE